MLLIKLAYRNVLRNKRRTIIATIAIGIGLASLIFMDAISYGSLENMIESATASLSGHAQIHQENFTKTYDIEKVIKNSKNIMKDLAKETIISNYSPRTKSYAMLNSAYDSASVMLIGINPNKELGLSEISKAILKGKYLDNKNQNQIIIGKKLAKKLDVNIGDKIVITVAQANTGELSQEMFRLSGLFAFGINEIDKNTVFINLDKSKKLLNIGQNIHEIAIKFKDIKMGINYQLPFWDKYSKNGNISEGWGKLFPQLYSMIDLTGFSILIFVLILFSIIAIGIVNTLFMSLYERMFEFGILKAIGTRPFDLGLLVVLESSIIGLFSIVFGLIIAAGFIYYFDIFGINYTGLEFGGVTIKHLVYPVISIFRFSMYTLSLVLFTILCGIYPAFYASKITPAKAIKKTL